ncbi:hypothetical protein GQX74_007041 [Glossina fuscipes]|nr:hypothetical protein GQX74_007041 [Glossina fuscipes]
MAKANVLEAMHTKLKAKKDVCVFLRPTTPREPVTAAIRPVHIPQPAVDRDASRTINSEPKATKEIAKTNCNRPKIICTGNAEQQAVLLCGVYDFFFNDLEDFIELPSSLISSGGNLCFLLILESKVAALEAIVSSNCFLNSSCDINFGFFKSSSIGFDITTNVAAFRQYALANSFDLFVPSIQLSVICSPMQSIDPSTCVKRVSGFQLEAINE